MQVPWGADGWGDAASEAVTLSTQLRLWQQDNFGEDLILLPRNGQLYYWDKTLGFNTRPRSLDSYTSALRQQKAERFSFLTETDTLLYLEPHL